MMPADLGPDVSRPGLTWPTTAPQTSLTEMSATTCTELPILPHDIYLLTLPYLDIPALLALKDASRDLSDAVRPLLLECLLLSGVGHSGDRLRVFEALKKGSDRGNESGALPEVAEGEADGGHAVRWPRPCCGPV